MKKLKSIASSVGCWYHTEGKVKWEGNVYFGCKIKKLFFGVYRIDYYDATIKHEIIYGEQKHNATVYLFPFGIKEIQFINN